MPTAIFLLAICLPFLLCRPVFGLETDAKVNVDDASQFQRHIGNRMTASGWICRGKSGLMIWLKDRRTGIVIASQKGCAWKSLSPRQLKKLTTQVNEIESKYNNCFVTVTGLLCRKVRQLKLGESSYFYFPVDGLKISTITTAVFVTKRIPMDHIIKGNFIEERKIEPKNFGFDFVSQKHAVGRKAKYNLEEGQILTESDLLPRTNATSSKRN